MEAGEAVPVYFLFFFLILVSQFHSPAKKRHSQKPQVTFYFLLSTFQVSLQRPIIISTFQLVPYDSRWPDQTGHCLDRQVLHLLVPQLHLSAVAGSRFAFDPAIR
jgi:hypothetical protein